MKNFKNLQRLPQKHYYQSAGAVEYTDCIYAEGYDPTNGCPDMTLNHLMVRLQPWRFGGCEVPLHCHDSQVHAGSEW